MWVVEQGRFLCLFFLRFIWQAVAPHRTGSEVSTLTDQGGQDRTLLVCARHSLDKAVCELKQDNPGLTSPNQTGGRRRPVPSEPNDGRVGLWSTECCLTLSGKQGSK